MEQLNWMKLVELEKALLRLRQLELALLCRTDPTNANLDHLETCLPINVSYFYVPQQSQVLAKHTVSYLWLFIKVTSRPSCFNTVLASSTLIINRTIFKFQVVCIGLYFQHMIPQIIFNSQIIHDLQFKDRNLILSYCSFFALNVRDLV